MFWVHVLGACVPLPVPYPYAPSQLPVSVLGPQELPLLITVQNGLLVSAGSPVEGGRRGEQGAGHPSPRDIHRGKDRATLWPGRGGPTEVHVVLPTMHLLQLRTRLRSSFHGASGVSTTLGQGGWVLLQGPGESLCPLPASDRGPRGSLAFPFFLGPWCTHTRTTHTYSGTHRHILTH